MSMTTSEKFVLVGDQASRGFTIIPVSTPLTHLNYFDGKFLRADDFRLEQAYQRALVALTARGAGSGVANGFELEITGGGASLLLHGGLAVSASGVVIDLPADAPISIADLIARSESGTVSPGTLPAGSADFSVCEAAAPAGPDVVLSDQPTYLITIAAAEALCGQEERFDQLCADACLTETDRPRRVSGVLVRARRLALGTLPTSSAVTFTQTHLRSQVATAYFEAERGAIPDRISATGLLSSIWCGGADAVTADEVPIGVLGRSGDQTTFLDLWTARREMMEPPSQRYWAWRMAMRPWDVFLAQVLQFQCQFSDAPAAQPANMVSSGLITLPAAGYLPIDPSSPVAQQLHTQFGDGVDLRFITAPVDHIPEIFKQAQDMNRISLTAGLDDPQHLEPVDIVVPLGRLSTQPTATLPTYTGTVRLLPKERDDDPKSGSFAVVSTVARDLSDGSNVAWAAAGHADLPINAPIFRALPRIFRPTDGRPLAAEPPASPPSSSTPSPGPDADGALPEIELPVTPDRVLDEQRGKSSLALRLNRMRALARARRQRIAAAVSGLTGLRPVVEAERSVAADEQPTIELWMDFEVNAPLADSQRRDQVQFQATVAVYQADDRSGIIEIVLVATLTVIDRVDQAGPFGSPATTVITTSFTGSLLGRAEETQHASVTGNATWTFTRSAGSTQLAALTEFSIKTLEGEGAGTSVFGLEVTLTPVALTGSLGQGTGQKLKPRPRLRFAAGWRAVTTALSRLARIDVIVATFQLARDDHALDPGTTERAVATGVIETIGAQLSAPDQDPGFVRRAMSLLFGESGRPGSPEITAALDWVLFTRRRQATRPEELTKPTPTGTRTYVTYHALINDLDELNKFGRLLDQTAVSVDELVRPGTLRANTLRLLRERTDLPFIRKRERLDDLGFERVGVVEFAPGTATMITPIDMVQVAFASQDRGTQLVLQLAADAGGGDGELILEERLAAYRGAIASLIDTSQVQALTILSEVPDDFTSPGIDGVLFTVGLDRDATPGVQRLFALTVSELAEINNQAQAHGGFASLTINALSEFTGLLNNEVSATFEGSQLTNADAVSLWWTSFSTGPPEQVDLHPSAAVFTDGTLNLERKRAKALLGGVQAHVGEQMADTGDARSVVFMVRSDRASFGQGGQLLVGVTRDELAKLDGEINQLGGYPAITPEQLRNVLANRFVNVALYEDLRLTNGDDVSQWWSSISPEGLDDAVIHPTTAFAGGEAALIELSRCASLIRQLVGHSLPSMDAPTNDAFGQNALVYLIRP